MRLANGSTVLTEAIGTCYLSTPSNKPLVLEDYLLVPNLIRNIISVSLLDKQGFDISINNNRYVFRNGELFVFGSLIDGIYLLDLNVGIFHIDVRIHLFCKYRAQ